MPENPIRIQFASPLDWTGKNPDYLLCDLLYFIEDLGGIEPEKQK